jgi:hypothetical protein
MKKLKLKPTVPMATSPKQSNMNDRQVELVIKVIELTIKVISTAIQVFLFNNHLDG